MSQEKILSGLFDLQLVSISLYEQHINVVMRNLIDSKGYNTARWWAS